MKKSITLARSMYYQNITAALLLNLIGMFLLIFTSQTLLSFVCLVMYYACRFDISDNWKHIQQIKRNEKFRS